MRSCGIGPWYPVSMGQDDNNSMTEVSDSGYPIEIYTDERTKEFLAEDELTPEQRRRLERKLMESKKLKSPLQSDRS